MSYLILALSIALGFPIYHLFFVKKIDQRLFSTSKQRTFTYKISAFVLWALLLSVLITVYLNGDNFEILGMPLIINQGFLILGILALAIAIYLLLSIKVEQKNVDKFRDQLKNVIFLLPTTPDEFKWYTFLSFSAGVSEEIVYRGFLYYVAIQYLHFIPAILLVNLVFAMAHLWSDTRNILGGFFLGIVSSVIYILSGSIWISVFLHFIVDLQAGLAGYRYKQYVRKTRVYSSEEE